MATTISVREDSIGNSDIDGGLATGIEALRQRIDQALQMRLASWFLRRDRGVPYDILIGHSSSEIATAIITATIRDEGGNEVTGILDFLIRRTPGDRILGFSCIVTTIYGNMSVRRSVG